MARTMEGMLPRQGWLVLASTLLLIAGATIDVPQPSGRPVLARSRGGPPSLSLKTVRGAHRLSLRGGEDRRDEGLAQHVDPGASQVSAGLGASSDPGGADTHPHEGTAPGAESAKKQPKDGKRKQGKHGGQAGEGNKEGNEGKGGQGGGGGKGKGGKKGDNIEGLTVRRGDDFGQWYSQLVVKAELIEYTDISGCYILRPWAFSLWETIQAWLDARIKQRGVKGCYFPLFVTEKALCAEKEHVAGFTPEVAWVTKSGSSDLAEPIAVRPTSETAMYPSFAKWIRSHRDLPLKINQWCNVVRWEFKHPTPFIRTREFLWQEGHTAHALLEDASAEVLDILQLYESVYSELLALPVIKGNKTETEKFAGALYTASVECFIPGSSRGIQAATSHQLGQTFGKMFGIQYEAEDGSKRVPWQNSWGLTTRSIGIMAMIHSDDKGLVLPPRVAPTQIVLIPVPARGTSPDVLNEEVVKIMDGLSGQGFRCEADLATHHTAGWKFNHWELKGVPLRLELGPRELEEGNVRLVRRDTLEKRDVSRDSLAETVSQLLEEIHTDMLAKATKERDERIRTVQNWPDFMTALNAGCMALAPFCMDKTWEVRVNEDSANAAVDTGETSGGGAKALCIPFEQPELPEGIACFISGLPAQRWVLWGRSY